MKIFRIVSFVAFTILFLGLVGCATRETRQTAKVSAPVSPSVPVSDSARMQGAWTGHESGSGADAAASHFTIAGDAFEFHGTDANEWYKGTFTLKESANPKQILITVKECPAPDYVGKISHGIYRFDGGKLIITANEPGNDEWPSGFEASGSRTIEFTK